MEIILDASWENLKKLMYLEIYQNLLKLIFSLFLIGQRK